MTRTIATSLRGALSLGVVAACLASAPAQAQAQIQIQITPPVWFIATTTPVYYEGHPSYWYGNQWHYREGRTWHTYREEPRYLHDQREHHKPHRHNYGHDHEGHGR